MSEAEVRSADITGLTRASLISAIQLGDDFAGGLVNVNGDIVVDKNSDVTTVADGVTITGKFK